jgi:hypothetical protein
VAEFRLRQAIPSLALIAVLPTCFKDINSPVDDVGISLGMRGVTEIGFLMLGDRDTVRAMAWISGWPPIVKFDSDTAPERFQYSSSAPSVAQVDTRGVVTAANAGVTTLHASSEGVVSNPLILTVWPRAARLLVKPEAISAAVGDTLTVTVSAVDERGTEVPGVPFTIRPDTTWWAIVSPPREGNWNLRTPLVLHPTAKMAGRVRLLPVAMHERATGALRANPVSIYIHGLDRAS